MLSWLDNKQNAFSMTDSEAAYLVARILTCGAWIADGSYRLTHLERSVREMTELGIPFARIVLPLVIAVELLGSLCLMANFYVWAVAIAWLIFLVPASYVCHMRFMIREERIDFVQYALFWKNVSIAGGAILLILLDASRPHWMFAAT